MGSLTINSIQKALENLKSTGVVTVCSERILRNEVSIRSDDELGNGPLFQILAAVLAHKLKGLRIFALCCEILTWNNGSKLTIVKERKEKKKLMILRNLLLCSSDTTGSCDLGSLLVRAEGVVSSIRQISFQGHVDLHMLVNMERLDEEIGNYLQQRCSTSSVLMASQVKDILESFAENLDDFLSFPRPSYAGTLVEPIEALKEKSIFWENFIGFATLLSFENREFVCFLTHIKPLAISAAHLSVNLFPVTHYDTELFFKDEDVRSITYDGMKSMILDLLSRIENPLLHEAYTETLEVLKSSRESYVPTLDLKVFISFLLSTVWEMVQLRAAHVLSLIDKLQSLYEALRLLRTLVMMKQQNKFDDDKIKYIAGTIWDAGIIIFSLHRKDSTIDHGLQDFLEKVKVIRTEVGENVLQTSNLNFPNTTALAFLDFLLDYVKEVKTPLSCVPKIKDDLVFLRSFLGKLADLRNQKENLHQAVWDSALQVAFNIEFLIDQLVIGKDMDSFTALLQSITEHMMIIKTDPMKITCDRRQEFHSPQEVTWRSIDQVPSEDDVVGFEDDRTSLINRLQSGLKKLQSVAIVGMPGLGKTTLATKVYNDPSVAHHFHVRAWCSISEAFNKSKALLDLLNHIRPGGSNSTMNEDDLAQEVWRSLKRRRYLIFLDDVWDLESFHCLKESLPDDNTESRILLTSRHYDVAILDDEPHLLRQFTVSECWKLLKKKLFPARDWPPLLYELGIKIAENCKGLPLTVVIVAGLLTTAEEEVWKEVLDSLRSGMISSKDQCECAIELSYKHLPDHLKLCFLSFGAYPEDHLVSVKRLTWEWIAKGFVRRSEPKILEEVAADYLNSLIGRSLILKAKESSLGCVKICQIHDLLRDFCLKKAKNEHLIHLLKCHEEHSSSDMIEISSFDEPEILPSDEPGKLRELFIYSKAEHFQKFKLFCPRLRSLVFHHPTEQDIDLSFIFRICKRLRVLDIEKIRLMHGFPSEIGLLLQLRYLAIQFGGMINPSIGNLSNLETLIIVPFTKVVFPGTFWNLRRLRHLYAVPVPYDSQNGFYLPVNNLDSSGNLLELKSLSILASYDWCIMEKQLSKFPNIRQLKCLLSLPDAVVDFSNLSHLESFSLSNRGDQLSRTDLAVIFPKNIKKLTLSECMLPWTKISGIADLPHLSVLKLMRGSFVGDTWHMVEGEFPMLKFLKLYGLSLIKWTASDDQFPNLEKLVLEQCYLLEEIPECLENVATLKAVEVRYCRNHLVSLIKEVEECQKEYGNSDLKVHVFSNY